MGRSFARRTLTKDVRDADFHPITWCGLRAYCHALDTLEPKHRIPQNMPIHDSSSKKRKVDAGEASRNAQANKKLKLALEDAEDVTNYNALNLPDELDKYWHQRYRLWSRFDEGIRMDREGWWSVTPESVAAHIAERCRGDVVVDAFCGVGGNAIQLAMVCEKVIAIDISPIRLACAAHNAEIYGVADRIQFVLADVKDWTAAYLADPGRIPIDAVFLSPPWGGIEYKTAGDAPTNGTGGRSPKKQKQLSDYSLNSLVPYIGTDLFQLASQLSPNLAFFLPKNTSLDELSQLTPDDPVEVEEAWFGEKLKAVTVYFGGLVRTSC